MTKSLQATRSVVIAAFIVTPFSVSLPTMGWAQIEEVVVTARKREERLQDVSLSIDVVDFQRMTRTGTKGLQDLLDFSPSFIWDQGWSQKDVRIAVRGLSPTLGRSNVAFLVDGIDVTSESFNAAGASIIISQRLLSDIERVEMVKGPQSALYGRAAFAGAVNYVTKDASEEFEARLNFEVAEYDQYEVTGSVSGPVLENILGLRLSGYYWSEDGQYTNLVTDERLGGGEGFGAAITANLNFGDNFTLKARVEYSDDEFEPQAVVEIPQTETVPLPASSLPVLTDPLVFNVAVPLNSPSYGDADGYTLVASDNPRTPGKDYSGNDVEIFRASLIATWDFPSGTITSYTGYMDANAGESFDQDYDAIPGPNGFDIKSGGDETLSKEDVEIYSQELRYASDFENLPLFGDSLQVTLGGNWWLNKKKIDLREMAINCWEVAGLVPPLGTFPFLAFNGVCQDLDVSLGFGSDDPFSGPLDTWQEVVLLNSTTGTNQFPINTVQSRHLSAYILFEWQFLEQWKLSLEDRYVDEEFELSRLARNPCTFVIPFNIPGPPFFGTAPLCDTSVGLVSGQQNSDYNTPKVTVEWTPTEDMLIYFSAATGRKPAGIEQLPPSGVTISSLDDFRFGPEKLNAYELGAKTLWSGGFGNLVANIAVFFQDYTDKQVGVQFLEPSGLLTRRTANAGSAEVIGSEFEFNWQTPIEGLTFAGGYTYLPKADFTEFTDITQSPEDIASAGNCTPTRALVDGVSEPFCIISYAGNRLERAPKHAFIFTGSLNRPVTANLDWFIETDTIGVSERFDAQDNRTVIDSYIEHDIRTGIQSERWEFLFFIDNVTDNDTFRAGSGGIPDFADTRSFISVFPTIETGLLFQDLGFLPPKRTFGIRGSFKY